ncbi:MAG: phytanoyl-CoA dioxygenase family protein, partial [Armatimonadota bacterium]|nr:phytanoyl-CoA dioxygenase family protein [Armatimonadota bacterium]
MIFTPEQVQQFQEQGYVALPDFWNASEVAALQAELERLKREGKLRNVATEGDGKTHSQVKANLQLCPMSPHSDLFRALPFAPKVIEAVRELIGDPVVLHLDQVFLKPGKHGAGTNWHQDNAYFGISDPLKGTAMWTAVHDATVENGTLSVIPGSFREKYEHCRDPQSDHHIRCYPPEEQAVPIELPAGGTVFFAYGVAHATGGNATDRDRAGAAYHFLNAAVIPSENYFRPEDAQKHPILSGPKASDGRKEYG